jgi:beta-lactam-binding protein with PASTA domain
MWQRIRRLGVELYAFFTTPFVLKNCLSMLGLMAGLLMLTFWWLKCYTNHGDSVQVPSYVGMSFREAARKARSRDFGVAVSDSLYVPGKPPGEIVAQDPKPESRVKEGRTIYFTVTKNNPDIIRLPELAGSDDYELYSRKLSRLGLKPRIVARIPDPKLGPNIIIDVVYRGDTITRKIRAGMPVEMGSTIDFIVSEEVTLTVNIPDCTGQTLDAAKFLIQTSELSVGTIIPDGTVSKDDNDAYVYRQSPKYDASGTMRKGEQIDLYITKNKPPDE